MERSYPVMVGGKQAGKALVERIGLYYHFSCRCRLSGDSIYRLLVTCGAVQTNLGILVPSDGSFVRETKIPVKHIGEGELSFSLSPTQDIHSGTFVPIYPEEPFAYLAQLKEAFLVRRNGQVGIIL